MNKDEIKDKLFLIFSDMIKKLEISVDLKEAFDDLTNNYWFDSITFISLIIEIELNFKITIPNESLLMDNFMSINGIVEVIEKCLIDNKSEINCI